MLENKKIIVGVTGGIAATKSPELVELLSGLGANVYVIMTRASKEFVSIKALRVAGAKEVITSLFKSDMDMPHIELAGGADLMIVAPATANIIAKLACGIADDALTTTALAIDCPLVIAPAMNTLMWLNQATRDNVNRLIKRGNVFIGPETGILACGDVGIGRMSEPTEIINSIKRTLSNKERLFGVRVLVSAGGTREPFDEVRFLGNRSSGKTGSAIARELLNRGASVTLITGAISSPMPDGADRVFVETAEQMFTELNKRFKDYDAVIMTAAVSDYKFSEATEGKHKKNGRDLEVKLVPTVDILKSLGELKKEQVLIGFAAECDNILENAQKKLIDKNLDMIVANYVGEQKGFESDYNEAILVDEKGITPISRRLKTDLAVIVVDKLTQLVIDRSRQSS